MDNLSTLLTLQQKDIATLFVLLTQETATIAARNSAEIMAIAEKKIALINAITQRDEQLVQQSKGQIICQEDNDKITQIKTDLLQCQEKNEVNGEALQRAVMSMHKLRNLFNQSVSGNSLTYDDEGNTSANTTLGTNFKA